MTKQDMQYLLMFLVAVLTLMVGVASLVVAAVGLS
jgi:hypothetical protein